MSLDQWTPATVAAAQANRGRRYGARNSQRNWTSSPMDAEILGRMYRIECTEYSYKTAYLHQEIQLAWDQALKDLAMLLMSLTGVITVIMDILCGVIGSHTWQRELIGHL